MVTGAGNRDLAQSRSAGECAQIALHRTRIFRVGTNNWGIPKGFRLKAQGCDPAQRESYPGTMGAEVRTTLKGLRPQADGGEADRARPRWGCGNFADVFPG